MTAKNFLIVLALLLTSAVSAFGCTCSPPPHDLNTRRAIAEWEIKNSKVIFEGNVEKISLKNWPLRLAPGKTVSLRSALLVSFSNVRIYRGELPKQFVIETGLGDGDCGYPFVNGKPYLVDAWVDEVGNLTTGICSATAPLEYADTMLRLVRNEPPTAGDLADLHEEEKDSRRANVVQQLCGKVAFPKGVKRQAVTVYFWRAEQEQIPFPVEEAETEQDGSYCIDWLDPGRYLIGAIDGTDPDSKHSRYASYYPGVSDRSQALSVVVPEKGAMPRVDFTLMRKSHHDVKGYVRGAPESGNDHLMVLLLNHDSDPFYQVEPVPLGPHGFFEFHDVPSGTYSAAAFTLHENDNSMTVVSTVVPVNVKSNVDGLTLEFVPNH